MIVDLWMSIPAKKYENIPKNAKKQQPKAGVGK